MSGANQVRVVPMRNVPIIPTWDKSLGYLCDLTMFAEEDQLNDENANQFEESMAYLENKVDNLA